MKFPHHQTWQVEISPVLSGIDHKQTTFSVFSDHKEYGTCGSRFQCRDNNWCIDEDLTCDAIDHCQDRSDESMGKPAMCEQISNKTIVPSKSSVVGLIPV